MRYNYVTKPITVLFDSVVGVDIETTGLDPLSDKPLLLQVANSDYCYIFDLRCLPVKYISEILDILHTRTCVLHNAKFDLKFLMHHYGFVPGKIFDTMLGAYLTRAGLSVPFISLKSLAAEKLQIIMNKEQQDSFLTPTLEYSQEQLEYAAQDAMVLLPLYKILKDELDELGLQTIYKMEFRLLPIVCKMELRGVLIDTDALENLIVKLQEESDASEQDLYKIAKVIFNPRSPKQVKDVFHSFGIMVESTGEDAIKFIKHPFAESLLKYRKTFKLLSSFGKTLLQHIQTDGRIHSTFNQMGTSTGRFSSSDINLQNIPASQEFRSLFIAGEGRKMITADFSQIELRLAGVLSGEESILSEYRKEDADLHRLTASKIFQVKPEEVTSEMRKHGKTGNFSCAYGTSAQALSVKQGITLSLAEKIVSGFWSGYPKLQAFVSYIGNEVTRNQCVRTALGRTRWFEFPSSMDPSFRAKVSAIKREAANFVIQGLAADIMKYAIILVDAALPDDCSILITVHDEVVIECPEASVESVATIVKEQMETAASTVVNNVLSIPANISIGDCWIK